jgi:hypothetical protein
VSKKRVQEVAAYLVWAEYNGIRYNQLREVSLLATAPKGAVKYHKVLLCRHIIVTDTVEEGDRVASEFQSSSQWQAMIADAQWELQSMGIRLEEWVDDREQRQWYVSTEWTRYS